MKKALFTLTFTALIALSCGMGLSGSPVIGKPPQGVRDSLLPDGDGARVEAWVENLEIPWSLIFLKDGRALVSERPGRIRLIKGGRLMPAPYASLDVSHIGEGGLMGLAPHPLFPAQPFIYAMHTYKKGGEYFNRVVRLRDAGDKGMFDKVVFDGIPGGRVHNGGRIAFGPDGLLYITAGETFSSRLAQDLNSLGGKILRITPEGGIPGDNPFKGSPVYSLGHRNPQGLAWQTKTGELFESEHGPSGEFGLFARDEINVIVKGGNYGWPEAVGAPRLSRYKDPIVMWEEATPPSGMTFYKGDLFVATLRSEALIRIRLKEGHKAAAIERWFAGKYGRLRDVAEGPDGALYFMTNNRDGRGSPKGGDDRIYRITPKG